MGIDPTRPIDPECPEDNSHCSWAEPGEFDDMMEDMPIVDMAKFLAGAPIAECLIPERPA